VRQLVKAGDHIEKGQAYAEVEVMKMMMPLLTPAAGIITFNASEGAPLVAGELIATLELVRGCSAGLLWIVAGLCVWGGGAFTAGQGSQATKLTS